MGILLTSSKNARLFSGAGGTTVVGQLSVVLQEVVPLFVQLVPIQTLAVNLVEVSPLFVELVPVQQFFVNIEGASIVDIQHCIGETFIRDVTITDAPGSTGSAVDITGFVFFFSVFDTFGGGGLLFTRNGAGEFEIQGAPALGIARLTITPALTTLLKAGDDRYRFDMWAVNAALERFPLAKGLYKLTERYTPDAVFPT